MPEIPNPKGKELYRFGPFRVDPEKETVLRAGEPVALTPKTFQILLVLVRHSREVVTKDDLMKTVWPDTFVEETNLSRNIFMLRKALGDTPQERYIVTVPGRGYRLAESVQLVPEQEVSIIAANHSRVQVQVKETKPWGWISLAVAVLIAVAGATYQSWHRDPILSERDTVVLADFTNSTGDPVFDGTLRQGMEVQLEQSPFLSLISDERAQQVLGLMGQPLNTKLTAENAKQICVRTGSAAVLDGSITILGSQYVLWMRARDCHSGAVLAEEQVQAATKDDVLSALGQVAGKFRARLGESLATVEQRNTPLEEATTSSLEALKAYSTGWSVARSVGSAAAVPHFKRVVEIDPQFAMAYASLGRMYGDTGESELSSESTSRAYQLRNHASDQERFFIDASYDLQVTGDMEKARRTCEAWMQSYPRDPRPHGLVGGVVYPVLGEYEKAVEEAKKMVALDPDFPIGYNILALDSQALGHLGEAESAIQQASERHMEIPEFFVDRYGFAFLKGDHEGIEREVARAQGQSGAEDLLADLEGFRLAYSGQLQQARRKSQHAADQAQQSAQPERAAVFETVEALREAFFGNAAEARRSATAALKASKDREVAYGCGFALALAGDVSRTEALANDLETRFPEDTAVKFSYVPTLRALIALEHGNPAKAIEVLEAARPHELGQPPTTFLGYFGMLYPVYVRGEAYLAEHQGDQAAAEFQKILDHPGIVVVDPIGALAHLQLARAYAAFGDRAKAKSAYRDFLTLWKDADPDIPVLKLAKSEYARVD
jgi:eukaryotic-like serine/threonine-protein kinase